MDIKGGAKKEASQFVGRKREGRGRCRKDHFDGHLETIQLCCGRTDGLSLREGEKEDLGSDERRKEGVKLGTSEGRNAKGERLTVFHSLSKCGGRGIRYEH